LLRQFEQEALARGANQVVGSFEPDFSDENIRRFYETNGYTVLEDGTIIKKL